MIMTRWLNCSRNIFYLFTFFFFLFVNKTVLNINLIYRLWFSSVNLFSYLNERKKYKNSSKSLTFTLSTWLFKPVYCPLDKVAEWRRVKKRKGKYSYHETESRFLKKKTQKRITRFSFHHHCRLFIVAFSENLY